MIAAFWNVLFTYGDQIKKNKGWESPEYKTYDDVCKILQFAYDQGEKYKEVAFEIKPKTADEAQIMKITGLSIFVDPQDGGYMYELDGRHFDTPSEVIQALIDDRDFNYSRLRSYMIRRVKKWWQKKAESWYSGTPCPTLEEYIEGKKKDEDKGRAEKKTNDQ